MRAVLALLALCVVLVGGGRAEAHAALVAAEPAAGSVVAEAPAAATLTFSEHCWKYTSIASATDPSRRPAASAR